MKINIDIYVAQELALELGTREQRALFGRLLEPHFEAMYARAVEDADACDASRVAIETYLDPIVLRAAKMDGSA